MAREARDLTRCLQESGLRLTPQRLLILETLHETDEHISAEEIYARVRQSYPVVNISTVYRTLDTLRELGLVTSADLGDGSVRYHWADKGRHHHLMCQRCSTVLDLDEDLTKELEQSIERRYSFRANLSHLTIFGTCRACQRGDGNAHT
jgi:Fur family ferric uptake transcriptional regulator